MRPDRRRFWPARWLGAFLAGYGIGTILAVLAWLSPALGAERAALVIGVEEYRNYRPSEQSAKRATEIAEAFKAAGFEVVLSKNPGDADARDALRAFADASKGAEAAVVVLLGHVATGNGNAFLLPINARLKQATDLLTQGVAIASIVNIASRAQIAAAFILPTTADIPSTVTGVDSRVYKPQSHPDNVTLVYSTSDRVPLSRVDALSRQAAADLLQVTGERPLKLSALVNAAAAGGVGMVVGSTEERDLSMSARKTASASAASPEARAREEALLQERLAAEKRAKEAEERAKKAETRAEQAERTVRSPEGLERAAPGSGDDISSLQVMEGLMGRSQRQDIQKHLQRIGLYSGPLDGVFGTVTRQAIQSFQSQIKQAETGYLTPQQVQALLQAKAGRPKRELDDLAIPADASRWDYDGSPVRLVAKGMQRTFIRVGIAGDKATVFEGRFEKGSYLGRAFANAERCGTVSFPVSGSVSEESTRVTLVGLSPVLNEKCQKVSEKETRLVFTLRQ